MLWRMSHGDFEHIWLIVSITILQQSRDTIVREEMRTFCSKKVSRVIIVIEVVIIIHIIVRHGLIKTLTTYFGGKMKGESLPVETLGRCNLVGFLEYW